MHPNTASAIDICFSLVMFSPSLLNWLSAVIDTFSTRSPGIDFTSSMLPCLMILIVCWSATDLGKAWVVVTCYLAIPTPLQLLQGCLMKKPSPSHLLQNIYMFIDPCLILTTPSPLHSTHLTGDEPVLHLVPLQLEQIAFNRNDTSLFVFDGLGAPS